MSSNEWISVNDRLPEWGKEQQFSERVLATDGDKTEVGTLFKKFDCSYALYSYAQTQYINKVTHWQPLPAPPKKESANEI